MIISGLKEGKRQCTANNAQNICNHNNYKTPERMNHSATEIASKLLENIHKTCINNRRSKTTKRSSVNCDVPPHKSSLAGYFS